jgi:hypothetical protein
LFLFLSYEKERKGKKKKKNVEREALRDEEFILLFPVTDISNP